MAKNTKKQQPKKHSPTVYDTMKLRGFVCFGAYNPVYIYTVKEQGIKYCNLTRLFYCLLINCKTRQNYKFVLHVMEDQKNQYTLKAKHGFCKAIYGETLVPRNMLHLFILKGVNYS